jgi:hypothetical protein
MARLIIYIAAPYSNGTLDSGLTPEEIINQNVEESMRIGDKLMDAGFSVFLGNLYHFWHKGSPRSYEAWFDIIVAHLPTSSAVLRIPGKSSGADREVAMANELGIPVFYDIESLMAHFGVGKENA